MPILNAPILEQAGFVKGSLEPVKNYIYMLDGLTKYFQFSEPITIPANVDYEIGFYASRALNDTNLLYIFGYSAGNVTEQHRLALSAGVPQFAYGMGFVAKDFNFSGEGNFTLIHNGETKNTLINFNKTQEAITEQTITIDRLMGPWLGTSSGYLNAYFCSWH